MYYSKTIIGFTLQRYGKMPFEIVPKIGSLLYYFLFYFEIKCIKLHE
jgi:hypothetical protein